MPRKTVVANQKGGVGKTTTAMNLAASLAMAGERTLLVDFDPQGNATTGLGLSKDPVRGTAALFEGRSEGVVTSTNVAGLDMLTSSPGLVEAESMLLDGPGAGKFLETLDVVAGEYDEVLVDSPPTLGGITRTALGWADEVLVPVQCEFFAMEGLAQILAFIDQMRSVENARLSPARVLLTMFDPALPFHREVVENLCGHLGERICRTVITRDISLAEAASHGIPIVEYDCLSRGAFAYIELGKEMLGHGREKTG